MPFPTYIDLDDPAVAEADKRAAPFLKIREEALHAAKRAASEYREVWQHTYWQAHEEGKQ